MNIFLDETILYEHNQRMGFPHGSVVKNPPAKKKKKKRIHLPKQEMQETEV